MSTGKRRVDVLESSLTPKQAFILWMQNAHQYPNIFEYLKVMRDQPGTIITLQQLRERVEQAIRTAMKGQTKDEVKAAERQAVRDVAFLFNVHYQVNAKAMLEMQTWNLRLMLLHEQLRAMLREDAVHFFLRRMTSNLSTVISYPLDGHGHRRSHAESRDNLATCRQELLDNMRFLCSRLEINTEHLQEWKGAAEAVLAELYSFQEAVVFIERRYFDGWQTLFPDQARDLANLVEGMEKLVSTFNDGLIDEKDELVRIDLELVRQNSSKGVAQQTSYLVDMAKAETLSFRGEDLAAVELLNRYL